MSIVNIMEEKIKAAVNEVLSIREDRFLLVKYMEDIVAYVLNRVPSRYITGERGFVHNEIDFSVNTQLQADIRFCVNDAIRTLLQRREPDLHESIFNNVSGKHYYFPYIVGEVLEESTFSYISDVEVQLLYDNAPATMIDPGWKNPYLTCNSTKSFYLFWPDFVKEEMTTTGENIFKVIFRHKKFYKKELAFSLRALENFNINKSKVVPLALLKLQEGEFITQS
jgi:hypothetical protein